MRCTVALVALALVIGAASCGENKPPKEQSGSLSDPASAKGAGQNAAVAQANPDSAAIPKGASWTILCAEINGPGHIQRARKLKQDLAAGTGMRDWHLLHQESGSLLYYGYYKNYADPKAKADRAKIDAMTDGSGRRPFSRAHFTPLEAADPDGPPEWNLVNAKGYWSLQIAVYKDSPDRKQYALDAVKAARQQGIEAYYYHGETMSLVCVGTWPREAVRTAEEQNGGGDQGGIKVVLPPLTPDQKAAPDLREEGRRVHVEAGRNEVIDPTLKARMDAYPTMAINGQAYVTRRTDPKTGKVIELVDQSFPVKIPHEQPGMLDAGGVPIPPPPASEAGSLFNDTPSGSGIRR
jgi:hypothetical protein